MSEEKNITQEETAEELVAAIAAEGIELTDEQLEAIAGGAAKTRKLVCNTCGYSIAANVAGVQEMTKHCSAKHNNNAFHVE